MDGFSVGKILAGLRNPELYLKKLKQESIMPGSQGGFNNSLTPQQPNVVQNLQPALALMQQLQMNQIAAMDRAVYIRNLLGLPQTLGQMLLNIQDKNKPINTNTLRPLQGDGKKSRRTGQILRRFQSAGTLRRRQRKKIRSSGPGLRFSDRSRTALRIAGRRSTQPPPWTG